MGLKSSEWALAGNFFCIFASLFAIAKLHAWHYSKGSVGLNVELVRMAIEGFVERPGVYDLPKGMPVGEALRKARPKRFADLRSIDLKEPVTSTTLKIEPLRSLQVHVMGEVVVPEMIEVEPGTRLCQLKQKIALTPDADLTFFKKRKFVDDGDVIVVPGKKNLKNSRQ